MSGRRLHFVIPGDIDAPTGGYGYDRRIAAGLRDRGWQVDIVSLPGVYPHADTETLAAADNVFAKLPDDALVLVDGLAYARLPGIAGRHAARLRLAALVHHPLADEGDLPDEMERAFAADETEALGHARAVACTSETTGRRLTARYGVARETLHVAPPGTEWKTLKTDGRRRDRLLCVGSIVPRKGHDVLIEALAGLADLSWTADFVGHAPDANWLERIEGMIAGHGLQDRVAITGPRRNLDDDYARAGIFALATRHEGYGMAYAEAMAAGLPVVGCAVGAVPEVVPPQAGALVPSDDPAAFAAALRPLLTDSTAYEQAARGARAAAENLPRWQDSAAIIARMLEAIDR